MKNNIKNIFGIWGAISLIILGILYYFVSVYIHGKNSIPEVCNEETCFTVELADTQEKRVVGLMNREAMSEKHGMLFIFDDADFHNFWMKNTLIPLDMVWIDNQFKVVRVLTAQPCRADPCAVYRPEVFANYVLEINAGMAKKYGIIEGTTLMLKNNK